MIRILLAFSLLLAGSAQAFSGTKHDGQKPNRLLKESSPYLRQHAYNPVNWYPWGPEAFAKAVRENKPILVSIGYSTCHWCHVMERESYSDKTIAKLLNDNFVAIKVDRERRPDVDETYILATEIVTGRSGWPNNVFLTPDLKPFVGGTYFPPEDFKRLLTQVALRWTVDQPLLQQEGERIAALVHRIMSHRVAAADVTLAALTKITKKTVQQFDTEWGGLGNRPKFPRENLLLLLLDMAEKHDDADALAAAIKTLDGMIHGGIQDQVGGGFHRYTVDRKWIVPHFEKMLYNQAQIGRALIQAYRITAEPRFKRAATELLEFVLRDMTSPMGGFYSAYDADSKRPDGDSEEGFFYLWTQDELLKALGAKDARFANRVFGTTFEGNFEGRNILHLAKPLLKVAIAENSTVDAIALRLRSIKARLLNARSSRAAPNRDDKLLTAWNGLMIKTLAEAGLTLDDKRYRQAALKAAEFFWRDMGAANGQLKHYFYDGAASFKATQADYATLALGFVALFDATQDVVWLQRAGKLSRQMNALFLDKKTNDYFMTAAGGGFYRPKVSTDGDIPSGNATALELFAKLSRRQLDPELKAQAEAILSSISGAAMSEPAGYAYGLRAADELLRGETGALQYLAKGRVRARARLSPDGTVITVRVNIAKGWHINAHKPLEDYFIPTVLTAAGPCKISTEKAAGKMQPLARHARHGLQVTYPKPLQKTLGFNDKPLALYEGDIEFTAQPVAGAAMPKTISLTAQTCSDKICLEPETIRLSVLQ